MKKSIFFFTLLFLICTQVQSYAGDLANDTVWTKETDQLQGFSNVQFIKNDEIIVAQSSRDWTLFYDAIDGKEIKRLKGLHKALFFDNDNKFLRLNNDNKRIEIFETETYQIIGELESDDLTVGSLTLSKDENLIVGAVSNGLRVWDLNTKQILRTKTQELTTSFISMNTSNISFLPNGNILAFVEKEYKLENKPNTLFSRRNILFDFETLDSISNYGYKGYIFEVSPTKKYIAYGTNGVEIYSLETGELVSNIQLNSDALTGIEFSNDEKFIVTSSTVPADQLAIWNIQTGKQLYEYPRGSIDCFDLSLNEKFITCSTGYFFYKLKVTDQMLSVDEQNSNTVIYPNPTNDLLNIKIDLSTEREINYKIYDLNSKLIDSNILLNNQIDVSNLSKGAYILEIITSQISNKIKFIKE